MDIEKIKAGFEELRTGALEVLASANCEDEQERLKMALYCYVMLQHQYAQALLPEDQRLSDEESENMTRVASILSYNLENVMSDFQSLLDKGQANDYYIGGILKSLLQRIPLIATRKKPQLQFCHLPFHFILVFLL